MGRVNKRGKFSADALQDAGVNQPEAVLQGSADAEQVAALQVADGGEQGVSDGRQVTFEYGEQAVANVEHSIVNDVQAESQQTTGVVKQAEEPEILFEERIKMNINAPVVVTPVNLATKILIENLGVVGDLYASQYNPVEFKAENLIVVGESKEFRGGAVYMRSASRPIAKIKHVR